MAKYNVRDCDTDEIVSTAVVENEDDLLEMEEMAEALGFYVEEV